MVEVFLKASVRWFIAAWVAGILGMANSGFLVVTSTNGTPRYPFPLTETFEGIPIIALAALPFVAAAWVTSLPILYLTPRWAESRLKWLTLLVAAVAGGAVMQIGQTLLFHDPTVRLPVDSIGAIAAATGHLASQAKGSLFSRDWLKVTFWGTAVGVTLQLVLYYVESWT